MRRREEIKKEFAEAMSEIKNMDASVPLLITGSALVCNAIQVEILLDCRDLLNDIRHNTSGSRTKRGG